MFVTPSSVPSGSDSPGAHDAPPLSREERRRRTEAGILDAARELFAEVGYERTTIRRVAARAGVDPALVMQYYGSKDGLFAASARWHVDHKRVEHVSREDLPSTALDDFFTGFEDPAQREGSLALMRNCLTHERARVIMRDEVICDKQAALARTIGGDDAALRAGLLAATMIGLTLSRHLLEIPAVAAASREDIERVLEPVLKALVDPQG